MKLLGVLLIGSSLLVLLGCTQGKGPPGGENGDSGARAVDLARRLMIVDTHIDVPYRLEKKWEDISVRTVDGDFDYPRAVAGGLNVPFLSIYVPASHQNTGDARAVADRLIDMVEKIVTEHPDKFAITTSVEETRAQFAEGKMSFALGMENGAPIEGDLANLRHFYDRGIRYITLTHSENNHICDSSYAEEKKWNGLSPFGREVVQEMNRLGIMIDVSHVSDATFEQVLELTRAPVIASHSSCRRFTPGMERNMSDEMIRRLADNGGVLHINFGSYFVQEEYNRKATERYKAIGRLLDEHELERSDEAARPIIDAYREEHPIEVATLAEVADHFDHVVSLVGIDHVGIGSDYDGVGDSLPVGLEDVSTYPNLIRELLDRGYSEADIEKICSGNLLRVWSAVERVAAELRAGG